MFSMQSSNPAIHNDDAFNPYAYRSEAAVAEVPQTATLQGVVNKTGLLVGLAVAAGAGGYWLCIQYGWSVIMLANVIGLVASLVAYFIIARKPLAAMVVGPIYAVTQGVFLGALTAGLDGILVSKGIAIAGGGLALQAFVITIGLMVAMLGLYSARIIRPTARFRAVLATATLGCVIAYGLTWILAIFGMQLPFVNIGSAMQGGTAALIGLGLGVLFLIIASLGLIVDFGEIEERVNSGAPKAAEWYCGFALLVTLAWIYYEALKIAFRLAMMFGSRD